MGELRQYLMQSRMELEATIMAAQEEIMKKEEELLNMKELLMLAIKERDEAQSKLQTLALEKLLLQQQINHHTHQKAFGVSNANTNTPTYLNTSPSSDQSEESSRIASPRSGGNSPATSPLPLPPQILAAVGSNHRPLPEKGRLLKAVMEAGPLLQTLLLAGPLPQWKHPPPQLESIEIPPVTISPNSSHCSPNNKRGIDSLDCSIVSSSPKCQSLKGFFSF